LPNNSTYFTLRSHQPHGIRGAAADCCNNSARTRARERLGEPEGRHPPRSLCDRGLPLPKNSLLFSTVREFLPQNCAVWRQTVQISILPKRNLPS